MEVLTIRNAIYYKSGLTTMKRVRNIKLNKLTKVTILPVGGSPTYKSDLYIVSPIERLIKADATHSWGFVFYIPIYGNLEFKIYCNNTGKWVYQSDSVNCKITQIDRYSVQWEFEDGGGNVWDVRFIVSHPGGFIVRGQEVSVVNPNNNFGKYRNMRYKGTNDDWNGVTL